MQREIFEFYSALRDIFVFCPACGQPHRLSDCKLFQKTKPVADWKDKLDRDLALLERAETTLLEKIELAKEASRHLGRKAADKAIRKIDPIFAPLKLNCNDSKVIFHPVDFIVFHGMNDRDKLNGVTEIILLDNSNKSSEELAIQKSIEKVVQRGHYEWVTLRVEENGQIKPE
jgi:predicted Holliday junction resolvase-like endonuclease